MPYSYSFFRALVALLLLCKAGTALAQRPPRSYVYDSLGRPIRANHELIVHFAPSVINQAAVSSRTGNAGPLNDFLKPAVANMLQTSLGIDLNSIYAVKSIAMSTPADSVTIDRTGQPVYLEPFWSFLVLRVPVGTDDYAMAALLSEQPFTVVKSVGMNWAFTLNSGSSSGPPPFLMASGTPTLLAYPQPAQSSLTFALPSPLPATADLTIFSAAGRQIRTEKHRVFQHGELTPLQIDLTALPAGQYFYRLVTPQTTYRGRFEKQE